VKLCRTANPSHANKGEREGASELNIITQTQTNGKTLGRERVQLCKEELEAATRLSSQLEDKKKKDRKAIEAADRGRSMNGRNVPISSSNNRSHTLQGIRDSVSVGLCVSLGSVKRGNGSLGMKL